jgi:cytochrome c6
MLAVRGSLVVCASSSPKRDLKQQQQQQKRGTAPSIVKTPSSIPQRLAAAALAAVLASSTPFTSPALAAEELAASPIDAPLLFSRNCAGCHAGGGNVVSPGNTLFEADLSRNGLLSSEKLFEVVYSGRGKMPGYGLGCAPKGACTFAARLSDEEVKALGDFVLERAGQGWK